MKTLHKWAPLSNYETDWRSLAHEELRSLSKVWEEQEYEIKIKAAGEWQKFDEKMRREWAIETGLIERVYTLDRGITETFIELGVLSLVHDRPGQQSPQKAALIISDHKFVIDGLFDFIANKRGISTSYIKELHAALLQNQETTAAIDQFGQEREIALVKGEYKKQPNNPVREDGSIHEYCPPDHVASEMDGLIDLHEKHIKENVAPEVEAAWLHHRFSQIHPFQDGNGRVARCLATLIFLRAGLFPLIIRDIEGERQNYIAALETADRGDLRSLVDCFAIYQRKAIFKALGVPQEERGDQIDAIIQSAGKKFAAKQETRRNEWEKAKKLAAKLQAVANDRLEEIRAKLVANISDARGGEADSSDLFRVDSCGDEADERYYFISQIIDTAKKLNYFANPNNYGAWSRLVLRPGGRTEILLSFHGIGREYRGVLVCSACFFRRTKTEEGKSQVSEPEPITEEFFQINYREAEKEARPRFEKWLEEAIRIGLALWNQSL